jgi:hypothetical protein
MGQIIDFESENKCLMLNSVGVDRNGCYENYFAFVWIC